VAGEERVAARRLFIAASAGRFAFACAEERSMCRNIRTLFNFEPPATEEEVRASALQFVRKVSGFSHPSKANQIAFDQAVDEVAGAARRLLTSLHTTSPTRDRASETAKAHERARRRFAPSAP
jgi:hypothetical protein